MTGIRECWGDEVAERMADAVVVCSGATMGTSEGIVHYVRTMAHSVRTAPRAVCADHDQRYHNYLLYTGAFERVRTLRAGHAEVYNLGYIGKNNRTETGESSILLLFVVRRPIVAALVPALLEQFFQCSARITISCVLS
jgi:hypothetical protein